MVTEELRLCLGILYDFEIVCWQSGTDNLKFVGEQVEQRGDKRKPGL
jgi:hypothetical protein